MSVSFSELNAVRYTAWREESEFFQAEKELLIPLLKSNQVSCALDIGCGQGTLTRRLRSFVPDVTGLDRDERSIELARCHPDTDDIAYVHDDFLTRPLPEGSFDLVTSVAALHHMDTAALERMSGLLRPGGVLAVIGLARGSSLVDVALTVPAVIGTRLHLVASSWRRRCCPSTETYRSPVIWPPPVTYRDIRSLAGRLLPQARYRRHLYWRYSLIWSKPS